MSIANEIQRIQRAKSTIKAAIEEKGVTVGNGTIDTYAEKIGEISVGGSGDYDQGYEDGKNSVVDLGRYATNIRLKSLNFFEQEDAILNLDNATSLENLLKPTSAEDENTTVKHLTINCSQPISNMLWVVGGYSRDETLERITFNVDISQIKGLSYTFTYLYALKVIDGTPLDLSSATTISSVAFTRCIALEEIRFAPNSIFVSFSFNASAVLSNESIQSIIDGLADLTGSTAQTLTLHATVGGKLTETQKATITAKNWTLVY